MPSQAAIGDAPVPTVDDPQTRILRTFTALHSLRPAWPGCLIFNIGLGPAGAALSFAANIAGAVCLSFESDPRLLRNAQHTGSCDFLVNTLDEAFRAMKNEIRKHRPLSVGVAGDPSIHLAEAMDRGLAPELFTAAASHPEAAAHFLSLGAQIVSFDDEASPAGTEIAADLLEIFLRPHSWSLQTFALATTAELRAFDNRALAQLVIEPKDNLRRQWLMAAARILPRVRHRTLWLTPAEHAQLSINP